MNSALTRGIYKLSAKKTNRHSDIQTFKQTDRPRDKQTNKNKNKQIQVMMQATLKITFSHKRIHIRWRFLLPHNLYIVRVCIF